MTIGQSSKMLIDGIIEGVREAVEPHVNTILATYRKEDTFTLSIPVKLSPGKNDVIQLEVGINFVESMVKESNIRVIDFRQLPLPGMETKGYKLNKAGAE